MKWVTKIQLKKKYRNDNVILLLWICGGDNSREDLLCGSLIERLHQGKKENNGKKHFPKMKAF